MIRDFFALEEIYGRMESALYVDDLLFNYEADDLAQAVQQGYLQTRTICIGPDCGRVLCWLTEKGRCKAKSSMH